MEQDDPKVHTVVEKLLDVLNTPSEAVQRAVSMCLSPLMQSKQVCQNGYCRYHLRYLVLVHNSCAVKHDKLDVRNKILYTTSCVPVDGRNCFIVIF